RTGRLHPVFDLPGVAELLGESHGNGLDALEHDRDPDHACDEHGREGGLARRTTAAADTLADRRKDVEEREHEQEGLHERAGHELTEVLAQHGEVALKQRDQRSPARLGGRPDLGGDLAVRDRAGLRAGGHGCHQSRNSLPVRLMNTVSSVGSVTDRSAKSNPLADATRSTSASRSGAPRSIRTVTIVSAPTDRFSACGVSRARMRPWSMIATRSQSWSASSM